MAQLRNRWVTAEDMVRSRTWREGYESYRRGQPPAFGAYGTKSLAYEYGRLAAAYLRGQNQHLIRVSTTRPLNEHYVSQLVSATTKVTVLNIQK